jgi:hypothetical protein
VKAQPVDDLVDDLALGPERDADVVELLRGHAATAARFASSWFVANSSCV